ncbi:type II toxin-antitoxin system Phd/YefM family antitoxin [Ectothiorhodospira sp. PHS-1]|uniref:type II toxin-antitoxin system Phd/YefM family antitoxin n=2 Tax=Ectothiorhodospira TaxID=1051 RepID=UPI001FEFAFA7|nr:type II toxin-antitoxin system Phd/YefM family antitoxin [Ectothiorhodospira sp. PHS-1]
MNAILEGHRIPADTLRADDFDAFYQQRKRRLLEIIMGQWWGRNQLDVLSILSKMDKTLLPARMEGLMRTITASEAKQGFAKLIDTASREPVIIQRQKRDVAVVLSMAEYERLTRLNIAEFQRFCDRIGSQAKAAGLDEAKLTELLASDD